MAPEIKVTASLPGLLSSAIGHIALLSDTAGKWAFAIDLLKQNGVDPQGFEDFETGRPAVMAAIGTQELTKMANAEPDIGTGFDLIRHLHRQREFSLKTFGPGLKTAAVSDHIRKELEEVTKDPTDLREWADVIILAFDGALRAGSPEDVIGAVVAKQALNERRTWPDWRTATPDKAIEHVRGISAAEDADALSADEIFLLQRCAREHVKISPRLTFGEEFEASSSLLARGFAERHRDFPSFIRITAAGREALDAIGWRP